MDLIERHVFRDLAERSARGDLDAYGRLVEATHAAVREAVRRVIRDEHLAEDAVQETYLRGFHRLTALRDGGAVVGWLRQVARTTALNLIRVRRRTFVDAIEVSDLPAPAEPEREWADARRIDLARAMVSLSPEDRRLCERYYHGRWPTSRLAAKAGLSGAAVRKRLERIRKRLRKEMEMNGESNATGDDLPARITEMLARPRLTDLPENPVGAVWEIVKKTHEDHIELDLPETLTLEQVETIVGAEGLRHLPERVHRVDDRTLLRWDTSLPMLVAATGRPAGEKLIAAGKVYRDDPVDRAHLQVFHQAEALHVGEDVGEWDLMPRVTRWVDEVLGGARLRIEQVSYPMICSRAWEVSVDQDGRWTDILAWGRLRDGIIRSLGHDPERVGAVAVGMGLERIACLRYGIDDVRKVAATRLEKD